MGLKDKSTTLSEDIEEMSGEPVWKVDDSDRGIMDLHEKPAMTIIQDIYNYQLNIKSGLAYSVSQNYINWQVLDIELHTDLYVPRNAPTQIFTRFQAL